jgi:hypothetical protein
VTTTTEATTSTTQATTTTSTTVAEPASAPDDTAKRWVDAIASGDDDTVVELVAPRSFEAFGGEEGIRDNEIALAEGWGAWSHSDDLELTTVRLDATTSIVIFHGTVSQEGPPEEGWAALPVVRVEEGDRVEPFLDLGNVEAHPSQGEAIEADQRFSAYVLGGRDVWFIVDDGVAVEPALQSADGDQQLGEYDVSGLDAGSHALTVVVRNDDGVMARTFEYVRPT